MLSLPAHRGKGSVRAIGGYIRLKLLTGLRRGDLLRLTVSDLKDDGISPWFFCNRRGQGYLDESARRQPGDREGVPAENRESETVEMSEVPKPTEMKPCPFCGGEPHLGYGSPGCWFVSCSKCKAMSDDRGRDAAILLWNTRTPPAAVMSEDAVEALALLFHNTYERLAPEYGYSTRHDTRIFDAKSANGRLVLAVCKEVLEKGYTLRRETMTEAELEREAEELIALIMRKKPLYTTGGKTGPLVDDVEDFDVYVDADEAKAMAMGLAKKYRG